jgi:hypothetical protein
MNQLPLAPMFDGSFPHHWQAEILSARPLILPTRHYVYPRDAEEVERGALEVLIRPTPSDLAMEFTSSMSERDFLTRNQMHSEPQQASGHDFSRAARVIESAGALAPAGRLAHSNPAISDSQSPQSFLATCALGFRDPAVPTGLWSCPNPNEICALSGGYAYIISTIAPENFTMLPYRPVLDVRPVFAQNLLLFVGHHSILAWGPSGQAWQSEKLSSEGITLEEITSPVLHGLGWDLMTDKETPFALDLSTGLRIP